MPEIYGTVAAKSAYGIKLGDNTDWWDYSKAEYRDEPFDTNIQKGDQVQVVYNVSEYTDDSGEAKTKTFITSITKVTSASPSAPSADDNGPLVGLGGEKPPGSELWAKDRLRARTDCIACATGIYKSSIEAGIYKEVPSSETLISYAESLEKWARE